MKSPSRAGALRRTASTGSDGRTTSSRRMFSSSIVWAVGGMSSVGSSARIAYWSRMWLSWPSSRVSSSSVRPRRARWATCSTSERTGWPWPMIPGMRPPAEDRPAPTPIGLGHAHPRIRPMTPADVDAATRRLPAQDWGDRRANSASRRRTETRPFVADAGRRIVGTGVAERQRPRRLDRHDLGGPGVAASRPRPRPRRRRRSTRPRRPAAGRSCWSRPKRAGRCTSGSGSRSRPGTGSSRSTGLDGAAADPRVRAFRAGDLDAMAALDAAATGEDRTHLLRAFAAPDTHARPGPRRRLARRVRHPRAVGRRRDDRARIEDAEAILHARRIARARQAACGPASWPRTRRARPAGRARLDRIVAGAAAGARRAARRGIRRRSGASSTTRSADRPPQPPPARTAASARRAWPRWTRSWPAASRNMRS